MKPWWFSKYSIVWSVCVCVCSGGSPGNQIQVLVLDIRYLCGKKKWTIVKFC